jgi:hypothetical protein
MENGRRGEVDIPVRRHGRVPAWAEESTWELEAPAAPRTIGEYGAVAVLAAALLAAAIAALVLYVK